MLRGQASLQRVASAAKSSATRRTALAPICRVALSTIVDDALLKYPKTTVTRLPNGMTVASESMPSLSTATVGLWICSGSRAENPKNNGVAHFLEHLLFKGTKTRSQVALEKEIENMGAQLNAYTSREQTVYYTKLFAEDVTKGVGIIGDLLTNCLLDERAVENERDVIMRELEEIENNMEETIFDHLHAAAFPQSPLGFRILGPPENIRKLSRTDLASYIATHYTPDRMVLVGVGNVDHAGLCRDAAASFAALPPAAAALPAVPLTRFERPDFVGSEKRIRVDAMSTAHMAIALESCSWTSPDYWPLQVASAMIGSYDRLSSFPATKLAQTVANDTLANGYMSFNTTYCDTGLWGIYMTSNNRTQLEDLTHAVVRAWTSLCTQPSVAELEQAKQMLKTSLMLRLDGSTPIAEEIGLQMLVWGRRRSAYEICKAIDAVTIDDVKRVAMDYIYDRDPVVVSLGPIEAFPDYNEIRAKMSLWRY